MRFKSQVYVPPMSKVSEMKEIDFDLENDLFCFRAVALLAEAGVIPHAAGFYGQSERVGGYDKDETTRTSVYNGDTRAFVGCVDFKWGS